jgi:hypothetical protein
MCQEQDTSLDRRTCSRNEDLSRIMRQDRRSVELSPAQWGHHELTLPLIKKGQFGVALNEGHFKDLLFELVPPPAQRSAPRTTGAANPPADLMVMGFPTRLPDTSPPSLCVCHSEVKSEGFLCPRCLAKVCDVPTDCDICGLMIVSSPHLARSYHHLFPVKAYDAVYVDFLYSIEVD